jgi:hypothetical protein
MRTSGSKKSALGLCNNSDLDSCPPRQNPGTKRDASNYENPALYLLREHVFLEPKSFSTGGYTWSVNRPGKTASTALGHNYTVTRW